MKTAVRTFPAHTSAIRSGHSPDPRHSYPLYDLISESGLTVSILPLGASIQKISVTDPDGQKLPIALGFPDIQPYKELVCYAGATLGPNAGRIRNACLPILGAEYLLSRNDNGSQLHGGCHNLSSMLWNVDSVTCTDDAASVLLSCEQPNGLDGYPGNRRYQIRYTLTEQGQLTAEQEAWTDRETYVNLSNHTYWNLSGDFEKSALHQELLIHAAQVCVNDENHLPVSLIPVEDTAFDFRKQRSLSSAIGTSSDPVSLKQLQIGRGYNQGYLLQKSSTCHAAQTATVDTGLATTAFEPAASRSAAAVPGLTPACILQDPDSKRTVRLLTDAPAVVLYSGGYLPDGLLLLNGQRSVPSCAIALEAQDLPDALHLLPSSCLLTLPEKPFHRIIRYEIFQDSLH